ncbi:Protein of unknown function [Gryllus bimaculatus]|nr:Protein of unknown function [Gryllus bimaculatus]
MTTRSVQRVSVSSERLAFECADGGDDCKNSTPHHRPNGDLSRKRGEHSAINEHEVSSSCIRAPSCPRR